MLYAVPAAVLLLHDVPTGLGLALGTIPAAVLPLAPRRRERYVAAVVGALAGVLAAVTVAAMAAAAGTTGGRWYVTPVFSTFLVFLLLLYSHPDEASSRFWERINETVLGVGVAFVFGLLVPMLRARRLSPEPCGSGEPAN